MQHLTSLKLISLQNISIQIFKNLLLSIHFGPKNRYLKVFNSLGSRNFSYYCRVFMISDHCVGALRVCRIKKSVQQSKSYCTFSTGQTHRRTDTRMDRHTDGQAHKNESPQYHCRFFCIYVRGKEGNSPNPMRFLFLHFVKDK